MEREIPPHDAVFGYDFLGNLQNRKEGSPMGNDNKLGTKIKGQVSRFCQDITEGMNKPRKEFFKETMYGMMASEDVKLSEVARSLGEPIKLIKTEGRLSRQMSSVDCTGWINEVLIEKAGWQIGKETVIAVDLTSIAKRYGKKMEALGYAWDGMEKQAVKGYEICEAIAAEVKGQRVIPLYSELYSTAMEGYESENKQILKAVDGVMEVVGQEKGIYVIDRGGDRKALLEGLLARGAMFVIRAMGNRHINVEEEKQSILEAARGLRCRYWREVTVETKEGLREKKVLHIGVREITLRFWSKPINLVVIKGWNKDKPMMLLTNLEIADREDFAQKVLEIYLTRWKCEEGFRFIKQSYRLEDVRVRSLNGLRNTVMFVHMIFYFISVVLGQRLKMSILLMKLCQKALRFFEIPSFKQYAIADGIYRVLFGRRFGNREPSEPVFEDQGYLPLTFAL